MVFEPDRYEREVIRPLRGRNTPLTDDDLLRRYAIEPALADAAALAAHLRKLRTYWNQTASGPDSKAQVCRRLLAADEELQKRPGADLTDPRWWRAIAAARAGRAQDMIAQLATDLQQAFGAVRKVTAAQVAGVAKQYPALDQADVDAAVRLAGVQVVEVVDLPAESGVDRVVYRELQKRLGEAGVPTVVQLLHSDLSRPFTLVQQFAVSGEPARRLDAATLMARIADADRAADSPVLRARRAALRILATAVKGGADLRLIALYQIVDQLVAGRSDQLVDALLVRQATRLGLTQEDAELVVASLPSDATAGSPVAGQIREMLAAGQLRAAQATLGTLPANDPERPQIVAEIDTLAARLATLLADTDRALDRRREDEAERLLQEATRIAEDDDEVRVRLSRLPMAPPRELRVSASGREVRLTWQPPVTAVDDIRFRIVRREGEPPGSAQDGELVAEGSRLSAATDSRPPTARDLHYAVFAARADSTIWSRPAAGHIRLTPEPADVAVRAGAGRITLTWQVPADVVAVRVRRTQGRPPRGPDDGVSVAAGTGTLVDREVDEGVEYFYGLTAVYHDDRRREVTSRTAVVSASTAAEARPLDGLAVEPVHRQGGHVVVRLTWPAGAGAVRIRYAPEPPTWEYGSTVSTAVAGRYGTEVPGLPEMYGGTCVLEADIPLGPQMYVPLTSGPSGLIVGRPVHLGQAEPIRGLHLRRTGSQVTVTWVWPEDAGLVEVEWAQPDAATTRQRLTRAAYVDGAGCVLPVGPAGGTVSVRAITIGPAGESTAEPVSETVAGRATRVRYALRPVPGWRNRAQRELEIVSDHACDGLELAVVVAPGRVMPSRLEPEVEVERFAGLALVPGVPIALPFAVPRTPKPYWIRCFVVQPAGVTLIDPPIAELKVS
ncbi:hypothetical protein KOI35_32455 [Actinoplanes bogorensis]|uniref:SaeA first Fn3-like domain-containing protein n=1 Tax=Paractinoplanes bogorensis TaxID=1610840 RepID=A0ABS5YXR9_9ACTN|nr:hypothetical protein [Actinoplanes bogorensis]MBU2668234.1 hypothetical protein [Actinoplanes bogorensis]